MGESDGGEKSGGPKEDRSKIHAQEHKSQVDGTQVERKEGAGSEARRGWQDWTEDELWPLKAIGEGPLTVARIYDEANTYSSTVSTITRQLTVAGFAVAWLFHETIKGVQVDTIRLPGVLWPALVLFIVTAFLDLCQYVSEATLHAEAVDRIGALELNEDTHVDLVKGVHMVATRLFEVKRYTLFLGYVALGIAILMLQICQTRAV